MCANTALAPYYRMFIESSFSIGPPGHTLSLTTGAWFSEGLLGIFFLLVGLEIRREMTVGALAIRALRSCQSLLRSAAYWRPQPSI